MIKYFILLLLISFPIFLKADKAALYTEYGKYNKGYVNTEIIKGYNKETIASNMYTIGGYYIADLKEKDYIFGAGITQTKIDYASKTVRNELIEQPETIVTVPYVFIGLNKINWSVEIGVSYYFNIEKFKEEKYINGETAQKGGWGLNRFKSHTFVNFKLRIFEENTPHLEFLAARDEFSPIDGILKVNAVYPTQNYIFNLEISLLMPANNFTESDVILKSNERLSFGIKYKKDKFNIGIVAGFLIKNAVGGNGYHVTLLNRLSTGLNLSLNF